MLGGGIPSGLGQLLAKLGLMTQPGAKGEAKGMQAGQKGEAKGALDKPGLEKGALLGKDGELAAGLGFAGKDKTTNKKNQVEEANVNRFLSEVQDPEMKKTLGAQDAKEPVEAKETEDAPQNLREEKGAETRREEGREEARQLAHKEAAEEKSTRMEKDAEAQAKEREQNQEEEDRPGAGWVAEEFEGDEDEDRKRGLRDADSLGETSRCRAELSDGTGCLRKPVTGTPYCRAHGIRPVDRIAPKSRV